MSDAAEQGRPRRRIDRVTDEHYLDGLDQRTPAQLRTMRDDCRGEEGQLSYARRLLQGRIDIVRAELARRAAGDEDLVTALPGILADRSRGQTDPAHALHSPVQDFPEVGGRAEEVLVVDASIGHLPELSDEEVEQLRERLEVEERRVSGLRRVVLDHLDRLQAELVARYRDGLADVDEVVNRASGAPPDEEPGQPA